MKKKLLLFIPLLIFGLSPFSYAAIGGNEKQAVLAETNQTIYESVKKELTSFLEVVPSGLEKEHGFTDRSEFAKALPASIYKIIGVDATGKTFETNLYNVVVSVNGEYRAVLTVSASNGQYEIQSIGAALMAKELQAFESTHPITANQERLMVNVYNKSAGFVAYQTPNTTIESVDLTPLESAKSSLSNIGIGRTAKSTYKLTEAVEALQLN
jgi:hypothetical protein